MEQKQAGSGRENALMLVRERETQESMQPMPESWFKDPAAFIREGIFQGSPFAEETRQCLKNYPDDGSMRLLDRMHAAVMDVYRSRAGDRLSPEEMLGAQRDIRKAMGSMRAVDFLQAVYSGGGDPSRLDPGSDFARQEYEGMREGKGFASVNGHPLRACRVALVSERENGDGSWSMVFKQACDIIGDHCGACADPMLSHTGYGGRMDLAQRYSAAERQMFHNAANQEGDQPVAYADLLPDGRDGNLRLDMGSLSYSGIPFQSLAHDANVSEVRGMAQSYAMAPPVPPVEAGPEVSMGSPEVGGPELG